MPYSRTESRYHSKKQRTHKRRKLIINGILLAVVAAGGLLAYRWMNGEQGGIAGGGPEPATSAIASASADRADEDATASDPNGAATEPSASDEAGEGVSGEGTTEPAKGAAAGQTGSENEGEGGVTLAFVGDVLPAASVAARMDKLGIDYPFGGAASLLQAADIAAGNLETPLSDRGTPVDNKQYVYVGKPEYVAALQNAGFDVFTLANNHTLDQGWDALSDTMDALDDAGIQRVGSGADDKEAFTPAIIERNGIRVAYIGLSHVVPEGSWKADRNHPGVAEVYDTTRAVAAIRDARELADVVVAMVHWGNELELSPEDDQFRIGHTLIDAGADLVVGSHPHVLQGFESYKGKWIAYSLGNFVFPTMEDEAQKTGVLTARCEKDGSCGLRFEPMLAKDARPAPMEPGDGQALLAALSERSFDATVDENGNIEPTASAGASGEESR